MKTYQVVTHDGSNAELWSDDTFTLHFGEGFEEQCESTPRDLADVVSRASLVEIAEESRDQNDRGKAEKALALLK